MVTYKLGIENKSCIIVVVVQPESNYLGTFYLPSIY